MFGSRVSLPVSIIDIMTEQEESARRQAEFEERTKLFMETLDLDEFFAQLLVSERFSSLDEVAYVELDELTAIEGIDTDTATELQARARDYIDEQNRRALERARELGVEDSLVNFDGLTPSMIEALAEDDVRTLEDFATCADWELAGGWTTVKGERVKDDGILERFDVSLKEAQEMVMTARIRLGWVVPEDPGAEEDGERHGGGGWNLTSGSADCVWCAAENQMTGRVPSDAASPRAQCAPNPALSASLWLRTAEFWPISRANCLDAVSGYRRTGQRLRLRSTNGCSRGAARRQVRVPEGFTDAVEALMVARVVGLVSLARKAGQAVAGYDRVRSWLVKGDATVLMQASDGSARGRSKLKPPAGKDSYVGVLTASELGLAFGRENVIHGALAGGGLSRRVVGEARRLSGMRQWIGESPGKGEKTV